MCKENKNSNFIQQFFSSASPTSAIVESTTMHACREELLNKVVIFVFFAHKVFSKLRKIPFEPLPHRLFQQCPYYISGSGNISVALLSMEGQRAPRFHQKYLNLCSVDEQRSNGFGTTWGWVINDRIFIFGSTIPLRDNQERNNQRVWSFFLMCLENQTNQLNPTTMIHSHHQLSPIILPVGLCIFSSSSRPLSLTVDKPPTHPHP